MIYTNLIKHNFTPKELKAYYAIHCKYHTMKTMIQQKKKQQVHINDLPYNTYEQDDRDQVHIPQ